MLATLLLQANRVVPADELAEYVWDGEPPPAAADTLRSYVMRLRRALGPGTRIRTRSPGYLIEADDRELDLLRFEARCRDGLAAARAARWPDAAALLSQALELWRGTPLQDVPSSSLRDRFVPRLNEMRESALEWRIEADLRLGTGDELVGELRSIIAATPLHERFHAQLMLALFRGGRQAEALDAYQRLRRALVEELGTEPGSDVQALHLRILAGDTALMLAAPPGGADGPGGPGLGGREIRAAGHPVPRQLPPPPPYFVGRHPQLKQLDDLASSGTGVVISVINGTAGAGKTALALHWAHQVAEKFPDGQLHVDLRGFGSGDPIDPDAVVRGFLEALAVPPARIPVSQQAQVGLYRSLTANRKMLVVLDNAHDSEQVRPLLPAGPGSLVLVTSRRRLTSLIAEGARPLTAGLLSEDESRELLYRRLGAERLVAEPSAVHELITLCARLPLALSILAARAALEPDAPLTLLAAQLHDVQARLDTFGAGGGDADVRAAFSWSYRNLSAPAARLFRLLGVHPGPDISVPAAASLAGEAPRLTRVILTELADMHLVSEHAPGRYALHDLLRAYAREQAEAVEAPAALEQAAGRMLEHYLAAAAAAAALLDPTMWPAVTGVPGSALTPEPVRDIRGALRWFEAETAVLLAVIESAASGGAERHAWQLCWALWPFCNRKNRRNEQLAVQQIALLAAERSEDFEAQALTHSLLGRVYAMLGADQEAFRHHQRALALYGRLGDAPGAVAAHYFYGTMLNRLGRHREALDQAVAALGAARHTGYRLGLGQALNAVGWTNALLGDYRAAIRYCEEAVQACRDAGDRREEAHTWNSLGYAHHRLSQDAEACRCYRRSADMLAELEDPFSQANSLVSLGDIYAATDERAATEVWVQALAIMEGIESPGAAEVRARLSRRWPQPG